MSVGCFASAAGGCVAGAAGLWVAGFRGRRGRWFCRTGTEHPDDGEVTPDFDASSAVSGEGSRGSAERKRRDHASFRRSKSATYAKNEMSLTDEKLVIAMVGLPARGKSYISKALIRYLTFLGCEVRIFNAGNLRRTAGKAGIGADFFDSHNEAAKQEREKLAMQCLDNLLDFLNSTTGCVAVGILDATNTTVERRNRVYERVLEEPGVCLLFLESMCTDENLLQTNYRLKLANDDYKGTDSEKAYSDFVKRVVQYEEVYQPVEDEEDGVMRSYIKIIDAGRKLIKCRGETECPYSLAPKLVFDLMHCLHLGARSIFLMVVAPSENDVRGMLGGDTGLAPLGRDRARAFGHFLSHRQTVEAEPLMVLCGTSRRHLEMASILQETILRLRHSRILKLQRMNELCVGSFDNMSASQIEKEFPEEAESRRRDKLNYRYPGEGGESYQDLVARMHEHILRLEQHRGCTAVLCDKRVCKVLLAYFRGVPLKEMPYMNVPHELIEYERTHTGFKEKLHKMPWRGRVSGIYAGRVSGIYAGRVSGIYAGRVSGIYAGPQA